LGSLARGAKRPAAGERPIAKSCPVHFSDQSLAYLGLKVKRRLSGR
jgi:hypothetical protein